MRQFIIYGESVPITRAGYGYNIGKKKYNMSNKKNLFKKGMNNDDVRKWERWSLKKGILSSFDTDNKASFRIDESVSQLLQSVSLDYRNTNAFTMDSWNILDGIVVFFSLLSLIANLKFCLGKTFRWQDVCVFICLWEMMIIFLQ